MKQCEKCNNKFEAKGDWQKLCTPCWSASKNAATTASPTKQVQPNIFSEDKERRMARMAALKASTELMKIKSEMKTLLPQEATVEKIIQESDRFISYILGE